MTNFCEAPKTKTSLTPQPTLRKVVDYARYTLPPARHHTKEMVKYASDPKTLLASIC